jgi:hypothetical protein
MGWQAAGDPWTGDTPGQGSGASGQGAGPRERPGFPGLLAEFEHGGPWAGAVPSAALATALEHAAGPGGRYEGAGTDALVGIARQWAAVESWAAAGKLAALRAMMSEDSGGIPRLRRRGDLPEGWDDSLTYEISGALAMGPVSAGNLAALAWTLGTRLRGIGRLLADGTLSIAKAKLVAQVFEPLDEDEAARAEALVLDELDGKTYFQVERLAWRAALAVAPDAAQRRRTAAERRARVTVFREESGTVGLSGRDLPAADALAGHASVLARAALYRASGAFADQPDTILQAQAYTDLLNGVSAQDRITFAAGGGAEPADGPEPDHDDGNGDGTGTGHGGQGPDRPDGGRGGDPDEPDGPDGGCGDPDRPEGPRGPSVHLAEVTVPLATLQRRADRAGENRLLGPLDPALARDLAAAAARSPRTRWEIIVVDEHGYATSHGLARPTRDACPTRGKGQEPPPTGAAPGALPARVNITLTEDFMDQLQAHAAQPRPGAPPPGEWDLNPGTRGTWTLTLPSGRQLTVRFDVVPVYDCDHRYRVSSYLPGDRLRRLVQVRDHECTWPPCSRPARESDFEHAVPYDKGGVTDACNAGARSRRCHQVKQLPGWSVTQPRPGWHVWTTPTGRRYVQEPWRYIA